MNRRQNLFLINAALAASLTSASAQTLLWSDTAFPLGPTEWSTGGFPGILDNSGKQLTVTDRNEAGDATVKRQVSTQWERVRASWRSMGHSNSSATTDAKKSPVFHGCSARSPWQNS